MTTLDLAEKTAGNRLHPPDQAHAWKKALNFATKRKMARKPKQKQQNLMNPDDVIPVQIDPDSFNTELPGLPAAPRLPSKTPGPVPAYKPDWTLLQGIHPYPESPIHE